MRTSIFGSKRGGSRIQGLLTQRGTTTFEQARRRLARLVGLTPAQVSDGDTAEYLARGDAETRQYLKQRP